MKKRLILNALLFCVSTSMVAQTSNKLTLDARMQVEKHQAAKRTRAAAAASAGTLSAIIKLDETCADKTLDALRTMGVKLQGRSRIKAVYSPFDESGRKVTADGMELPGSVVTIPSHL